MCALICTLKHLAQSSKQFSKVGIITCFTNKQIEAQTSTIDKWQNPCKEIYRNIFLPLFHRISTNK